MSPSKCQDSDLKGMINGARPSPLRISKDSHSIHKPSFSSSHHQPVIENTGHTPAPKHNNVVHKRQAPVIIYTHSPKVIHAQARDFMALVQKLTGLSSDEDEKPPKSEPKATKDEEISKIKCGLKNEENEATYSTGHEKYIMGDDQQDHSTDSQMYKIPNSCMNPAGAGPLFTPSTNDFLCSSSRTNSFLQSPDMVNSISPSYMDYVKGFQEY